MTPVWVGVDGGGTRSRAVALDDRGDVAGRAAGGPGRVDAADPEAVVPELVQVARAAAPPDSEIAGACFALAGAGRGPERERVAAALRAASVAPIVQVVGDVDAALHDAFGRGPGILLVAGTGSIAVGRSRDGRRVRAGGWGMRAGDEGSGWWIGVEAVRSVLRAHDGRDGPTALIAPVLAHARVNSPEGLVAWIETAAKGEVAGLAPAVLAAAEPGDVVVDRSAHADAAAAAILDRAADALVELVAAVRRRLPAEDPATASVALTGGLLGPDSALRRRIVTRLAALRPVSSVVSHSVDAARGAAELARLSR